MRVFYNVFIYLYYLSIKIASLFNSKARKWIIGRRGLLESMFFHSNEDDKLIWFHCSSLGEFEQGRPVMERLKKDNPRYKLLITFFSPSGYEVRKNFSCADYVFYLPLDTPRNAKKFLDIWNPSIAVFVKYEYWFNFINELHKRDIPLVVVSAIFRKKQHFFRFYGFWFIKQLKKVTYFLVQNKESLNLLAKAGIRNVSLSGDTRFDRVYDISVDPQRFEDIERFIQASIIFVGGSTWMKDEEMLIELINKNHEGIKYIIAPHEIDSSKIDDFIKRVEGKAVKLSDDDKSEFPEAQVLVIDRIGILSHVYQYASVAYVGGGFGKGIHNVLEAAVFGMPVLFGPNYKRFSEALELVKYGGAFPVKNSYELSVITYKLLSDFRVLKHTSSCSKEYVKSKKGATEKSLSVINAMISPERQLHVDSDAFIMN